MNVLSLFDGISCGQQTLKNLDIKVDNYYASEIDKFGISVANKNFPNTIQLGDVSDYKSWDLPKIDIIIGGSPCQGFSMAGKQLNFDDPRSKLFFEFVNCIKHFKPKYFLLENVKMNKKHSKIISNYLGVTPFLLKSCYFGIPQHRPRLFWTNLPMIIDQFETTKVQLKDILSEDNTATNYTELEWNRENISDGKFESWDKTEKSQLNFRISSNNIWSHALSECTFPDNQIVSSEGIFSTLYTSRARQSVILAPNGKVRHLKMIEEERLQGLPDDYTKVDEDTKLAKRKSALGNCWTVPVIEYILLNLKNQIERGNI